VVGGKDADRESIDGLARARKLVAGTETDRVMGQFSGECPLSEETKISVPDDKTGSNLGQ
jgi:hypothetical protein